MQPRSRRAVIVLDALGLAALAALFVLWCVRTPGDRKSTRLNSSHPK